MFEPMLYGQRKYNKKITIEKRTMKKIVPNIKEPLKRNLFLELFSRVQASCEALFDHIVTEYLLGTSPTPQISIWNILLIIFLIWSFCATSDGKSVGTVRLSTESFRWSYILHFIFPKIYILYQSKIRIVFQVLWNDRMKNLLSYFRMN